MDKTALIVLKSSRIRGQLFAYLIAQALQCSLRELHVYASIVTEEEGGEADWVFGLWDADLNLKRFDYDIAIHVTSEQLPYYHPAPPQLLNRWYSIKERLQQYDYIFEHSLLQTQFLREYIPLRREEAFPRVVHFPWGYSPKMDYVECGQRRGAVPVSLRRVHFLGGLTPRRRRIVNELSRNFAVSTDSSYADPGYLVKKAVIGLNLHGEEQGAFAAGRVIGLLLGNKVFTITEPFEKEESIPLVDRKHLIVASNVEDMKEAIEYFLEHKQERKQIAEQGYEFVRSSYTMTQNLQRALRSIGVVS